MTPTRKCVDCSFESDLLANLDLEQIYLIFAAALEYMESMGEAPPKFLN